MRLVQLLALFAFALLLASAHASAQSLNTSSVRQPSTQGMSEIDYEFSASALLCNRHRIVLDEDGNSTLFTKLCRNQSPSDRTTYCQVKHGTVPKSEFEKLVSLLQRGGFFKLKRDYELNPDGTLTTEGSYESTRVIRMGKAYEVIAYDENGPSGLWAMLRAIEDVSALSVWNKVYEQPTCPPWEKGQVTP